MFRVICGLLGRQMVASYAVGSLERAGFSEGLFQR